MAQWPQRPRKASAARPAQSVSASEDRELWPQVSMKWALGRWHLVPFSPDKLSPSLAATQDERKEGCPTAISGAWHGTFSPEERSCEPECPQQQSGDWGNNREAHPKPQCHCPVWLACKNRFKETMCSAPPRHPCCPRGWDMRGLRGEVVSKRGLLEKPSNSLHFLLEPNTAPGR